MDELIHQRQLLPAGIRTEPLPTSGAMKVLKRELRAPYWEGHDRAEG